MTPTRELTNGHGNNILYKENNRHDVHHHKPHKPNCGDYTWDQHISDDTSYYNNLVVTSQCVHRHKPHKPSCGDYTWDQHIADDASY